MKWRYRNDDSQEQMPIPIIINSTAAEAEPQSNIRGINNKIFYYADVDEGNVMELNRGLYELDMHLQNAKNIFSDDGFSPVIHLHLNTYGGSIFAAFAVVDAIHAMKSKVYTYVDGCVASAGTLISTVGDKRFIGSHGHVLIHQLSSGVYGKYSEMEDEMTTCTNLMKLMKDFYKKHTKLPMKKLDELMKRDIWLNADEALQFGIVDEIL